MIEIGKKQKLIVAKTVDFGVYLAEDKNAGQEDRVLLPAKQVPEGTREGNQDRCIPGLGLRERPAPSIP